MSATPNGLDAGDIPSFGAHEHWGSIASIGMAPEGFRADTERGATPSRRTGLFDIVLDPYFGGWLAQSGVRLDEVARGAGHRTWQELAQRAPAAAMEALRPFLEAHRLTGAFQCLRRGILGLYGHDLSRCSGEEVAWLDDAIAGRYQAMFAWYGEAMHRCRFTHLLRPVHPEFYLRAQSDATAKAEAPLLGTLLRIDPLLELRSPEGSRRLARLAQSVNVEPSGPRGWRTLLEAIVALAASGGAVGIKQLQAYTRDLEFRPVRDEDVRWEGHLEGDAARSFRDWAVHECCRLAHERGWVHQVHVGTHNLAQSSPLPLGELAVRYPRMKLVLLHCWPYLAESGWLAKHHANVFLDTCWMPVLSPSFVRQALGAWLTYVPYTKITCSHDATSVEMAAGSLAFTREAVAQEVASAAEGSGASAGELRRVAAGLLHDNSAALYGLGTDDAAAAKAK